MPDYKYKAKTRAGKDVDSCFDPVRKIRREVVPHRDVAWIPARKGRKMIRKTALARAENDQLRALAFDKFRRYFGNEIETLLRIETTHDAKERNVRVFGQSHFAL